MSELEEVQKVATLKEVGTTGLRKQAGIVFEEFIPHLQGERGQRIFREMGDNDAVLSGILYTFEMLLRQADWEIRPNEAADEGDTEAEELAEFVQSCIDDMSHSFSDFLAEVATMFRYGWSFFEIVYKRRKGLVASSPGKSSMHDDGRIGWRKMAMRGQDTLWRWEFSDDGGIEGFVQYDGFVGREPVTIPIEKGLLFRTTAEKNNPEGKSLLRGAYRSWYYKKRLEEIEAIGAERDLAGMPVFYAPEELFDANAPAPLKALLEQLKTTVRKVRRDEQDGMVVPLSYDDDGHERFRFELMSSAGSRQMDIDTIVRRKSTEMAQAVLADFIQLGHEQVGTFALSRDKSALFATALQGFLDLIAHTFNRHAIPRLLMLNGLSVEKAPRLTFSDVRSPDLTELSDFISKMAKAGAQMFPDNNLQAWLHEKAGMPEPSPEDEPAFSFNTPNEGGGGEPPQTTLDEEPGAVEAATGVDDAAAAE